MPSILPNYEYDIFISYRQNDNKGDGWVTNFVEALKDELEATLKTPVSIYFDENQHDGLLETHQVNASLEKKLKCLVFIPIISQTYCDMKSFAWTQEFLPFVEMAKQDELGMNITLSNGNVVSRVLPIRIHDLETEDQSAIEAVLDGPLRPIDFIYRETGVNSPLKPDDDRNRNLENTDYKYQLNKVANSLKDIGKSIVKDTEREPEQPMVKVEAPTSTRSLKKPLLSIILILFIGALSYWGYIKYTGSVGVEGIDKSIAVLPFTNTKPNMDTDYLGFAIANQIIGELGYNKALTVRPSSAVRKYGQKVFDAEMVADDLKVNYVLTGNYLMVADVIRLDIELVDINSNKEVWRDKLEIDFKNAFELQDIVTQKVVEGLEVEFSPQELDIIKKDVSLNPLAYEYYLRGISYPLSMEGAALAIEMLKKSIALDSSYAPAYTEIGNRANRMLVYGSVANRPKERPEEYYLKALSLNEYQLDALANLAALYAETGRTEEAVAISRKALELAPNNASARFSLGYIYRYAGMLNESIAEMEAALLLHPSNSRFRSLGVTYMNAGEIAKAYEAIALDNGSVWELGWQIILHFQVQEFDKVIELADKLYEMDNESQWTMTSRAIVAAINENPEEGIKWVKELEESNTDIDGKVIDAETSYYNARNYAVHNYREGAVRCLRKAVKAGYFNYPFMNSDLFFNSLKDDKEYQAILAEAEKKHLAFKEEFFNN